MAWGAVNGFLVAKAKVPALIVTLGTLSVALGLAQVITGGIDIRSVPSELTDFSAYTKVLGIPGLPFVALLIVILGGILLHKTRFGRYTFAIGSNEEAARRTGIKVTRHLVLVYALAGTLAGVGAMLSLAQFGTTTIAGQSLTNLNVIAAVVIGGTSIFGGEGTHLRHRCRPVHPGSAAVRVRHHRRRSRSGRASRWARCSSPPSTSTSPDAPPPCGVRVLEASSNADGHELLGEMC